MKCTSPNTNPCMSFPQCWWHYISFVHTHFDISHLSLSFHQFLLLLYLLWMLFSSIILVGVRLTSVNRNAQNWPIDILANGDCISYLLLHLPVAGCKQETYSVSLLSKAFRSDNKERFINTNLATGFWTVSVWLIFGWNSLSPVQDM